MSLSSALSVALTGLQTSSLQLQLTANNIANAQTPGYSQKSANLTSIALGGVGAGVQIAGFTRATDDALTKSLNAATSNASLLGTQNDYMKQVQGILNSTSENPALSDAISQFAAAWTQLQAEPESTTRQSAAIQAGVRLASVVGSIASQVQTLDRQVQSNIGDSVTTLNTALATVATLNEQISTAVASHQPTGDLEDARDQTINTIAALTNVNVMPRANGQIALYTSDGVPLLDGTAQTFSYDGTIITNANSQDVTANLTGGALQAQIQFRATAVTASPLPGVNVIQKLNSQLSAIVDAFTTSSAGPPETFAHAFNPTGAGDDFFTATGSDPATFAVNSDLLDGSSTIPEDNVAEVAASFTATFDYTADGLSLTDATYAQLGSGVLSSFQQAANTIKASSQSAIQQQTFYRQSLSNATGVNVDTELVNLTTLQNSYAASAHVISTINEMFKELTAIIS